MGVPSDVFEAQRNRVRNTLVHFTAVAYTS